MTIRKAIRKAEENGWSSPFQWMENIIFIRHRGMGGRTEQDVFYRYIFLDPLFWQALGKSLDWPPNICPLCESSYVSGASICGNKEAGCLDLNQVLFEGWLHYWHRFIDHLADGKTPEEFFKQF